MTERTGLDLLRDALTGASRAIAGDAEVELAWTADAPTLASKSMRVPMPTRALPADQVAEARGVADGFALRLRHHDGALHARLAPAPPVARAVFDAIETVRVELLGARGMAGMRDNLTSARTQQLKSDPIARAKSRDDVPLSSAVALLLRERLGGDSVPNSASAGVDLVREWVESAGGADMDALGRVIDDQRAFAEAATRLLQEIGRAHV